MLRYSVSLLARFQTQKVKRCTKVRKREAYSSGGMALRSSFFMAFAVFRIRSAFFLVVNLPWNAFICIECSATWVTRCVDVGDVTPILLTWTCMRRAKCVVIKDIIIIIIYIACIKRAPMTSRTITRTGRHVWIRVRGILGGGRGTCARQHCIRIQIHVHIDCIERR